MQLDAKLIKLSANGQWKQLLQLTGINESFLSGKHSSCPICGGKDRFRFDNKNGEGTYICNQCGAGDGISLVQKFTNKSFPETLRIVGSLIPGHCTKEVNLNSWHQRPKEIECQKRIDRTWKNSKAVIDDDPVHRYLLETRKLQLKRMPDALRTLLSLYDPESSKCHPAMVAKIESLSGELINVHRTYLTKDGRKANLKNPKKIMKRARRLNGCAIKLFEYTDILGIAEGIETALACHLLFEIPVWACISSSLMVSVEVPETVKTIVVFGDNDVNGAGQRAANQLATKMYNKCKTVKLMIPSSLGEDWTDVYSKENCDHESIQYK